MNNTTDYNENNTGWEIFLKVEQEQTNMAEPTVLEWDKDKAIELFNAYKTHWQENLKYGITGKGDAGTGKPNSKTVWQTILRHG